MSKKLINGEIVEETAEDIAEREAQTTQTQQERQAEQNAKTEKENLKASAKQKLMNGEALTEDEANVMVGL
jgi:hypothetical protein|tara:strand:+ start:212 stop:424 length:213 start_codon:yes stop_codon:yes gene_type:complete